MESDWIPSPIPAIYADPQLAEYRRRRPLYGIEGSGRTPCELGYGRSVSFNHGFIGREAPAAKRDNVWRAKVTLVFNPEDVATVLGADVGYYLTYAQPPVVTAQNRDEELCQCPISSALTMWAACCGRPPCWTRASGTRPGRSPMPS